DGVGDARWSSGGRGASPRALRGPPRGRRVRGPGRYHRESRRMRIVRVLALVFAGLLLAAAPASADLTSELDAALKQGRETTRGPREYFDRAHINDLILNHPDHHWKRSEVIHAIKRTLFKPGTRFSYSNSGYVVLGGIVEKVTHGTIEHAFQTRIAGPLGLTNS